jgi:hypothetical protein
VIAIVVLAARPIERVATRGENFADCGKIRARTVGR